ncbi:MAG: hypothetical protein AAFY91_18055, partial [Bacteroidota bacterium]
SWYFDIRHRNNGKLLARELATPSLSSANFDELGGDDGIGNWAAKHTIYRDNPDLIYTDLTHHGYIILEVDLQKVRAEYHYSKTILEVDRNEYRPVTFEINHATDGQ